MSPPDPAQPAATAGSPAMTVEGWVLLSALGSGSGVVLSGGAASLLPGAAAAAATDPCAVPSSQPSVCQLALL